MTSRRKIRISRGLLDQACSDRDMVYLDAWMWKNRMESRSGVGEVLPAQEPDETREFFMVSAST